MKYITRVNGRQYEIVIDKEEEILVNGQKYEVDFQQLAHGGPLSLLLNNHSLEATVHEQDGNYEVLIQGELYTVEVQDERAYRLAQARGVLAEDVGQVSLRAPMPGLILDLLVAEGDAVRKGDKLVILESMKMENELRASRDGVVTHVRVEKGQSVEKNQELVTIGDAE